MVNAKGEVISDLASSFGVMTGEILNTDDAEDDDDGSDIGEFGGVYTLRGC